MLKEFREFAAKGNVVDLAVAVIVGAAFGKIIGSIVDDIIMPVVGAITGGLDFSNPFIALSKTVNSLPAHRFHSVSDHSRIEHAKKGRAASAATI